MLAESKIEALLAKDVQPAACWNFINFLHEKRRKKRWQIWNAIDRLTINHVWFKKILIDVFVKKLTCNWRLKCQSWAIDCSIEICRLFDARNGVKKQCQTWHRIIQALTDRCHVLHRFLTPCLAPKSSWTSYL